MGRLIDACAALGFALSTLAWSQVARADPAVTLPSMKFVQAAPVTPDAALTFYGAGTTHGSSFTGVSGFEGRSPEIIETAKGLHNDPKLIFEYVRNHIDTEFAFGLRKGGLGALIDKSGTPFDQNVLFVEMVRAGGGTARYRIGKVTLNATAFQNWAGLADRKAACQMLASGAIPASFPEGSGSACPTSGTISTVTILQVWSEVNINGNWVAYDPSYKVYSAPTARNITSDSGYTAGALRAWAEGTGYQTGATPMPFIFKATGGTVDSNLTARGTQLANTLKSSAFSKSTDDVLGIGTINQEYDPSITAPAYTITSSDRTITADIPDQYRTKMTVSLFTEGTTLWSRLLYTDETYGRRIGIGSNFNDAEVDQTNQNWDTYNTQIVRLEVDDVVLNSASCAASSAPPCQRGRSGLITIAIDHPYAPNSGTYADQTVTKQIGLVLPTAILNGFGRVSPELGSKWGLERDSDDKLPANGSPPYPCGGDIHTQCREVIRPPTGDFSRQKLAASWLGDFSRMFQIQSSLSQSEGEHHHSIGVVDAKYQFNGYAKDPEHGNNVSRYGVTDIFTDLNIDTTVSLTSSTSNLAQVNATSRAIALASATLEGATLGSNEDMPDVASTASRLAWSNSPEETNPEDPCMAGPRRFYDYTGSSSSTRNSNYLYEGTATGCVLPGSDYFPNINGATPSTWKTLYEGVVANYISAGFSVSGSAETFLGPGSRFGPAKTEQACPTQGDIGCTVFKWNEASRQRGGALVATKMASGAITEVAHALVGLNGLSKGGGGKQPERANEFDPLKAADVLKDRFVDRGVLLGVDLRNGSVGYTTPALVKVGSGDTPYGLDFMLTYKGAPASCAGAPCTGARQGGWTHNWDLHLSVSGSNAEAMGATHVQASATSLIAFLVMQDAFSDSNLSDLEKDVFASLAADWWRRQMAGNTVTVNQSFAGQQYVRRVDGSWLAPVGAPGVLTQMNQRVPIRDSCEPPTSVANPLSTARRWDISNVSFSLREASGVTTNFNNWAWNYDEDQPCALATGFKVTNRTWPQGPAVEFVTPVINLGAGLDPSDVIGVKTHLTGLSGPVSRSFDLNTATSNPNQAVFHFPSISDITVGQTSNNATDANAATWTYELFDQVDRSATARPRPYQALKTVYAPLESGQASASKVLAYTYDALNHVDTVADATALQWGTRSPYSFNLADAGRGERVDPNGGSYAVYYDTDGDAVRYVDEIGRVTTSVYDGRHRVLQRRYPQFNKDIFTYDGSDNVASMVKQAIPSTSDKDILVEAQWNTTWNKPAWITRPRFTDVATQEMTNFTYFASGIGKAGLLQQAQRPLISDGHGAMARPTYQYDYSAIGQLTKTADPTGVTTVRGYDGLASLTSTTQGAAAVGSYPALNYTTTYTPNDFGDPTLTVNARNYATTTSYDNLRRKTLESHRSSSGPSSTRLAETAWTYDKQGRVTLEQHAKSFSGGTSVYVSTATQYTPTGKAWRVTDPDGRLTVTTFDGLDRTLQVTDGSGRTNGFTYDLAGQKVIELHGIGSPDQATYATYTYTDNGLVKTIADANANTTRYDYNGQLRLIRTAFPNPSTGAPNDADDANLTYDAPGNILTRQTRSEVIISTGYDALERMTSKAVPPWTNVPARNTAYAYDLAGRRLEVSDDWGHDLTWVYGDSVGRYTSHAIVGPQWSGTETLAYQYDANSNRTELKWPENYRVDYTYDGLERMDIVSENNAGTLTQLADYDWNALSRRMALTYATGGSSISWSYSDGGDPSGITNDVVSTANDVTFSGAFDPAHRLTSEIISNVAYRWYDTSIGIETYAPDRLNRYSSVAGVSFTYDGNQNLSSDGTWVYGYDPENRLLVASKTGTAWGYAYDPLGRRVSKSQTTGGSAFDGYLNDGDDELGDYSTAGSVLRRYVPGAEIDKLIAVREWSSLTFFHPDLHGSTVAMSNANGAITEGPYSYDEYGTPSVSAGVRYRYLGSRYDQETGLYYLRARYYSSMMGRFLQTDPIGYGDSNNLYSYVNNDPMDRSDPSGLSGGGCDPYLPCSSSAGAGSEPNRASSDKATRPVVSSGPSGPTEGRTAGSTAGGQSSSAASTGTANAGVIQVAVRPVGPAPGQQTRDIGEIEIGKSIHFTGGDTIFITARSAGIFPLGQGFYINAQAYPWIQTTQGWYVQSYWCPSGGCPMQTVGGLITSYHSYSGQITSPSPSGYNMWVVMRVAPRQFLEEGDAAGEVDVSIKTNR